MSATCAPSNTMLGKSTEYIDTYSPALLTPIPRSLGRDVVGVHTFKGVDVWRLYEITWINANGMPIVAAGEIHVPAMSPFIVESKSLKLYIGSLTQTVINSVEEAANANGMPIVAAGEIHVPAMSPFIVESKSLKLYIGSLTQTVINSVEEAAALIQRDVSKCVGTEVGVHIEPLSVWAQPIEKVPGVLLEDAVTDLTCHTYEPDASLLALADGDEVVEETLSSNLLRSRCPVTGQPDHASLIVQYRGRKIDRRALLAYIVSYRREETLSSNLLRSRCPVTGQPDHASLIVQYRGRKIDRRALLAYIVSYRRHQGFHEQCAEQIFTDIMKRLAPDSLSVFACFTRRGGIDISPFRSTDLEVPAHIIRTPRQ